MEAPVDPDLYLQKSCPQLITEFRESLPLFLWKSKTPGDPSTAEPNGRVRRLVRWSRTDHLTKLIDFFQEWPQLLDPHLSGLLDPLVCAFTQHLSKHAAEYYPSVFPGLDPSNPQRSSLFPSDLIPLPTAICILLYTFCKVRGQRVISRFLSSDPQYLEDMIVILENWSQRRGHESTPSLQTHAIMGWQERYIVLLWISHLVTAPFDFAAMGSDDPGKSLGQSSLNTEFPAHTPRIAKRLLHISAYYLSTASKEREAAALLLTRVTLRPDMCRLHMLDQVLDSIYLSLIGLRVDNVKVVPTMHQALGILLVLVKIINSAEKPMLRSHIKDICNIIKAIRSEKEPLAQEINSSAVGCKLIIKLTKSVALATIKLDVDSSMEDGLLERLCGNLLSALSDTDTSVRVAASKSLSLIVLQLQPDLAEVIYGTLNKDFSAGIYKREDPSLNLIESASDPVMISHERSYWDFEAVNDKKWHGLVLTWAQLLLRSGVPDVQLSQILKCLSLALRFEQRSIRGTSGGANVRDAACFGFWALARRYTTSQLSNIAFFDQHGHGEATIQRIANDLVVAATLDPTGNIRRGASAALQELVGRHPDSIKCGIKLVQIVDYHAVGLASLALQEVAMNASQIDLVYWNAIMLGLLGWRGICSSDANTRRMAAFALGRLTVMGRHSPTHRAAALLKVLDLFDRASMHNYEKRHGVLLALNCIVLAMHEIMVKRGEEYEIPKTASSDYWSYLLDDETMLWIERSIYPALRNGITLGSESYLNGDKSVASPIARVLLLEGMCSCISAFMLAFSAQPQNGWLKAPLETSDDELRASTAVIRYSLHQKDPELLRVAISAAVNGFHDFESPTDLVSDWISEIEVAEEKGHSMEHLMGVIAVLGAVFPQMNGSRAVVQSVDDNPIDDGIATAFAPYRDLVMKTLVKQAVSGRSIEIRCAAMRSLASGILNYKVCYDELLEAVVTASSNYTIDQRGDVGSLLRIEAVIAISVLLQATEQEGHVLRQVLSATSRLAVEKLDKVRFWAWKCLKANMWAFKMDFSPPGVVREDMAWTASVAYFSQVLPLSSIEWTRKDFFKGYVTSAGAGSDAVMTASRKAFAAYAHRIPSEESHVIGMTVVEIFMDNHLDERLSLPTMECLVFIFQADLIKVTSEDREIWLKFFKCVQYAHRGSLSVPKCEVAVKLYSCLVGFAPLKAPIMKKMCQMLLHPFTSVREAVADALYLVTEEESLKAVNWARQPRELEGLVEGLKAKLVVGWSPTPGVEDSRHTTLDMHY